MVESARPCIAYFSKRGKKRNRVERIDPSERPKFNYSGSFAYWIAGLFHPERIRLLGFDMESGFGHFYRDPVRHNHGGRTYHAGYYNRQREELAATFREQGIDTLIWQRGWMDIRNYLKEWI